MARGRLGTQKSAVGSSDSEDVEEQQLHLQGWQGHDTKYDRESDLGQLFKSFAGNRDVQPLKNKGSA